MHTAIAHRDCSNALARSLCVHHAFVLGDSQLVRLDRQATKEAPRSLCHCAGESEKGRQPEQAGGADERTSGQSGRSRSRCYNGIRTVF